MIEAHYNTFLRLKPDKAIDVDSVFMWNQISIPDEGNDNY